MTMTTNVRFLDPIDPRNVWQYMLGLFVPRELQDGFKYEHFSAGAVWFGDIVHDNSGYRAEPDQGAHALIDLEYGPEGSLLNDAIYADDDGEILCPPAYVEVGFDTPYSCSNPREHDQWFRVLEKLSEPGRVYWMRGECCSAWHCVPETSLTGNPTEANNYRREPSWRTRDRLSPSS